MATVDKQGGFIAGDIMCSQSVNNSKQKTEGFIQCLYSSQCLSCLYSSLFISAVNQDAKKTTGVCVCVSMRVCVYMYIYMYMYILDIYTHTHTLYTIYCIYRMCFLSAACQKKTCLPSLFAVFVINWPWQCPLSCRPPAAGRHSSCSLPSALPFSWPAHSLSSL